MCALFSAGALVIVINYTGDRIHFGLAVEKAKQEGLKVYFIKVLVKPKHVDVVK